MAYASCISYDADEEYFEWIEKAIQKGYRAVKLHCYGIFDKDVQLVKKVQEKYGYPKTGIRLFRQ